ncbi:hypothetical protein AVEN_124353-1 [Araneus ventricosus]|uniref:Uncharacterized protein n=1 Tax=Araneus ventricosus TaxID=182803 RepID=A0A4Y2PNM1_ARAVE|nr:hypothetical protein AVEN_124353-1 [Araneus ventricosus]
MGKTDRAYNAKSAIHTFKQRPNMAAVYPCDWQLPIKIESGTKAMGKRVSLLKRRIEGFSLTLKARWSYRFAPDCQGVTKFLLSRFHCERRFSIFENYRMVM